MIQQRKKICRLAWKIGLILTMLLFSVTADWQRSKAQTTGDTTTATITITEVKALSKLDGDLPPPINCKEADFFAVTMIDTQEKPTAQIDNNDHIYPNWQHTALIQQATGTIPIVVRLYDFDDHFCGSTDHVDINNTDALDLHLTLDLQTCQISGDLTGDCWTPFSSQGTATDRAFIAFNIKIDAPFPTIRGQLFETGADGSSQPVHGHTVRVINLVTNKMIAQQQTNSAGEFAWFNLRVPENVLIGVQIDECSGPLHCEHATPEILDPQGIPPVDVKPRLVTLPPCAPVVTCTYPSMKFSFRRIPNYVEVHLNSVDGPPVAGSEVYRWKLNGTSDGPWLTNAQGGVSIPDLQANEQLIAMSPQYTQTTDSQVHDLWAYKIYITSMIIGVDGKAQLFTVPESTAVHKLVISPNQTMVSFNLVVSVEGDIYSVDDLPPTSETFFAATSDITPLDRLSMGIMRANGFLFDVTDGQFLFGKVKIFDSARHWHEADIRIAASNRVRPHTVMGGEKPVDAPYRYRTQGSHLLLGRFWNRYGTVSANDGETTTLDNPDGWRVLVHEFLHYAVGLLDEYFVIDEATGEMMPALCTKKPDQGFSPHENYLESTLASIMAWPYAASEIDSRHTRDFSPDCEKTQHFQVYQESAWETIVRHYNPSPGPYQGRWQIKPATGEHALPGPELPPLLAHKAQPIKVAPTAAERDIYRLAANRGEITFKITLAGVPVTTDEVQVFLLKHYGNRTLKTVIDQGTVTKEGIITVVGHS